MYPLLLKPIYKDYLWGGTRLKSEYGFSSDKDTIAEAWMLSCHKDGTNEVLNGELKGKTLTEALAHFGDAALGIRANKFPYFPLLIKLIDAKQKLSIQVHPDDDYALKNEGEFGKTEMWYVVDCDKNSELIYGFKNNILKEQFEEKIKDNTITDVTNRVKVDKGDVFFISAGTLHAIGEGILIAEVQQNSNTTYRVSDYGRLDANGNPRQLHIEKALEVTRLTEPSNPYGKIGKTVVQNGNTVRSLSECEFFKTELLNLNNKYVINNKESFVSIVILDGCVKLEWQDGNLALKKGDSVFIPADFEVIIDGKAEILCSSV